MACYVVYHDGSVWEICSTIRHVITTRSATNHDGKLLKRKLEVASKAIAVVREDMEGSGGDGNVLRR